MSQVQSFKKRRANSPVALRHELIAIRHCLKIARSEWGLFLKETPFEQISLPKPPKSRKRRLSDEEYQKLQIAKNNFSDLQYYIAYIDTAKSNTLYLKIIEQKLIEMGYLPEGKNILKFDKEKAPTK